MMYNNKIRDSPKYPALMVSSERRAYGKKCSKKWKNQFQ